MTKEEAIKKGYEVEEYGGAYLLCDYSGRRGIHGAAYMGRDGEWENQPIVRPFFTEDAAWAAVKGAE